MALLAPPLAAGGRASVAKKNASTLTDSNRDPTADWADMRIFLAVLDNGSLGAAAEVLNLSQPTVGRRLSALESRLGSQLFARTGRRMVPTEVARSIEEAARRMSQEMSAIERTVAGASEGLCGVVTISATEGTGSEWLLPVLRSLRETYPDITIKLNIDSRAADLVGREADIALRLFRPTQLELIARQVATLGFGIYASRDFLAGQKPIGSTEDLKGFDWVVTEFQGQLPNFAKKTFDSLGVDRRVTVTTNSMTSQLRGVEAGLGLGILSHRWASLSGVVERVLPELEVATMDMWLVSHTDLRYSARIRAVADHIADAAREDAELFRHGGPRVDAAD